MIIILFYFLFLDKTLKMSTESTTVKEKEKIFPSFTELRIYPSFSEIREKFNAPQVLNRIY